MSRNISIQKGLDWTTVLLYLILVLVGWLSIYGASYTFDQTSIFDFDHRAGKQFAWILTSFTLAGIILLIDFKVYNSFISYIFYGLIIGLLILTIFIAPDIKGSHSWLVLGPINFQPAELAKVATSLVLAYFIGQSSKNRSFKDNLIIFAVILLPMSLIILQKETGSALVFAAFFLALYREGMNGLILLFGLLAVTLFIIAIRFGDTVLLGTEGALGFTIAAGLILLIQILYVCFSKRNKKAALILSGGIVLSAVIIFVLNKRIIHINIIYASIFIVIASCIYWFITDIINRTHKNRIIILFTITSILFCFTADYMFDNMLQPHQQTRIKIVLGMENDLMGAGYNVNQSKIAIGSGGLFGKGFLNGTQTKLKYVPEQDTDFIFCTVGEEFGFLGSAGVLLLYLFFLLRLILIAERQKERFSRVYGYCVTSIIFFHVFVNVGMVLGLLPVIGIPLPFFSYGGSSLWAFTILVFILLRIDASRTERF